MDLWTGGCIYSWLVFQGCGQAVIDLIQQNMKLVGGLSIVLVMIQVGTLNTKTRFKAHGYKGHAAPKLGVAR